jgi:hypothetical protein
MSESGGSTVRPPARWDVFVSHASEDKEAIARPLAEELRRRGLKVWYDEFVLEVGDSLSEKIDEGLASSHHGIVILSSRFFEKDWPKKELAGLTADENGRRNRILPVWHEIAKDAVARQSPTLADRKAATASDVETLADELISAIEREASSAPSPVTERLSLSPPPAEVELSLVVGGRNVLERIAGRHEYTVDVEQVPKDIRTEVASWLDELRELAEIWGELPPGEREEVESKASEITIAILEREVLLQLGPYERRLSGGDGVSTPWLGIVVRAIAAEKLVAEPNDEERHRAPDPDPSDQAQLDQLLGLITRPSVKRLQFQDFQSSWPEWITTPFKFLAWDHNEVEHAFKDPDLEAERQRLMQAANDFLHKEAMNGFPSRHIPHMRDAGYTAGEAEGLPEREQLIEPRLQKIREAAAELVDVYDDLVRTAKDKGYDLNAMKADIHPKVAEHDQRIAEIVSSV